MDLLTLKRRIQETLGQDVISTLSLVTMVNNCTSVLQSKDYRQYRLEIIEPTNNKWPYEFDLPVHPNGVTKIKRMLSVHLKNNVVLQRAQRISLADITKQVNSRGDFRVVNYNIPTYYIENNVLYLDINADAADDVEHIRIGYYESFQKLPMTVKDNELETTIIPIRSEFEDVYVFYGLMFYAQRFKARPEVTEDYNNMFRYFMEDMSYQLDLEDQYYEQETDYTSEGLI
jgi:hypothetical protein